MNNTFMKKPIIITSGEPSGIGPDLIVNLSQQKWNFPIVVCGSKKLIYERAEELKIKLDLYEYQNIRNIKIHEPGKICILPIETIKPVITGKLCEENAFYVINMLKRACIGCLKKEFFALITCPIHKEIINKAGIPFTGHTEFLAEYSHCKYVVMMLVTKKLKVALATTHIPLNMISSLLTKERLYNVIKVLNRELKKKFKILSPKIFVCGLNPHAGEGGFIGKEEIEVIIPILKKLIKENIKVTGPYSADTVFQKKYLKKTDVILSMYHDQGLPVFKSYGFGNSINMTLGLPFTRISVDHGTAIDLAGKKKINVGSFTLALNFIKHYKKTNK